ncbi:hypothetical protein C8Q75DRAFT_789096 [Abortiporus biennis]|nr:hypothetical protein C8Q75DRAFT_789096 [Abortiporus biennis]
MAALREPAKSRDRTRLSLRSFFIFRQGNVDSSTVTQTNNSKPTIPLELIMHIISYLDGIPDTRQFLDPHWMMEMNSLAPSSAWLDKVCQTYAALYNLSLSCHILRTISNQILYGKVVVLTRVHQIKQFLRTMKANPQLRGNHRLTHLCIATPGLQTSTDIRTSESTSLMKHVRNILELYPCVEVFSGTLSCISNPHRNGSPLDLSSLKILQLRCDSGQYERPLNVTFPKLEDLWLYGESHDINIRHLFPIIPTLHTLRLHDASGLSDIGSQIQKFPNLTTWGLSQNRLCIPSDLNCSAFAGFSNLERIQVAGRMGVWSPDNTNFSSISHLHSLSLGRVSPAVLGKLRLPPKVDRLHISLVKDDIFGIHVVEEIFHSVGVLFEKHGWGRGIGEASIHWQCCWKSQSLLVSLRTPAALLHAKCVSHRFDCKFDISFSEIYHHVLLDSSERM